MPEVGAYEAKIHLPKLLERIQKGERFVITKHGRPIAELIPASRPDTESVRQTIKSIHSFRETLRRRGVHFRKILKKGETLRDLAHLEHRY